MSLKQDPAPDPPDWVRLIRIFSKAMDRMREGAQTYGEFVPATDKRCLLSEAQEEILDAICYLAMQWDKLEVLKNKTRQE